MKYDKFEKKEIDKVKWFTRIIRFFSNYVGASVCFLNINNEKSQLNIISLIKKNKVDYVNKDDFQPIFIEYGSDSIVDIGEPKVISKSMNVVQLW